jgi:hypothetical protein
MTVSVVIRIKLKRVGFFSCKFFYLFLDLIAFFNGEKSSVSLFCYLESNIIPNFNKILLYLFFLDFIFCFAVESDLKTLKNYHSFENAINKHLFN